VPGRRRGGAAAYHAPPVADLDEGVSIIVNLCLGVRAGEDAGLGVDGATVLDAGRYALREHAA
jgi:hypothetical protein